MAKVPIKPFLVLSFVLIFPLMSSADFSGCTSATNVLQQAAETAEQALQALEMAKDEYQSACSSYGYDHHNRAQCGPYGSPHRKVEEAKSHLARAVSSLRSANDSTNISCAIDPHYSPLFRVVQEPSNENEQWRSQLQDAKAQR